ncbi:hypothetical protein QF027_008557 [Streptomyces canus]|nr:hypothetical protein [Streptomyces canus]
MTLTVRTDPLLWRYRLCFFLTRRDSWPTPRTAALALWSGRRRRSGRPEYPAGNGTGPSHQPRTRHDHVHGDDVGRQPDRRPRWPSAALAGTQGLVLCPGRAEPVRRPLQHRAHPARYADGSAADWAARGRRFTSCRPDGAKGLRRRSLRGPFSYESCPAFGCRQRRSRSRRRNPQGGDGGSAGRACPTRLSQGASWTAARRTPSCNPRLPSPQVTRPAFVAEAPAAVMAQLRHLQIVSTYSTHPPLQTGVDGLD